MKLHLIAFFILGSLCAFSQNPTYGMSIWNTTPPYSTSYSTTGPSTEYPIPISATCRVNIPDRNPPNFTLTISPSTLGFRVGVLLPGGGNGPCAVPVLVSVSSYQVAGVWDPSDPAPGIGSKIALDWVFLYPRHLGDQTEVYCNTVTVVIDPILGPDQCG